MLKCFVISQSLSLGQFFFGRWFETLASAEFEQGRIDRASGGRAAIDQGKVSFPNLAIMELLLKILICRLCSGDEQET